MNAKKSNDGSKGLVYSEADRKVWAEELDAFVPARVFDAHVHMWSESHATAQTPRENDWRDYETDVGDLQHICATLFPGREVHFLAFGTPVRGAKYVSLNEWVARELEAAPASWGAVLVAPEMTGEQVAETVDRHQCFVALKPYPTLTTGAIRSISDYLPERLMEVAEDRRLAVVLHLHDGPARAVTDLEVFTRKYPHIQWILAHCARPSQPDELERVVGRLKDLPNLWYDTATVRDAFTHALLLKREDHKRILFGTDNANGIGGCRRGLPAGGSRAARPDAILFCYEQLRAQRRACALLDVSPEQIEDIFSRNAARLLSVLRGRD